jgi:hypothetical protein
MALLMISRPLHWGCYVQLQAASTAFLSGIEGTMVFSTLFEELFASGSPIYWIGRLSLSVRVYNNQADAQFESFVLLAFYRYDALL